MHPFLQLQLYDETFVIYLLEQFININITGGKIPTYIYIYKTAKKLGAMGDKISDKPSH